MKWSDLKNQPVVGLAAADKLGFLDDMYLDVGGRDILGFRVRQGGLFTRRQAVMLSDIESFGSDVVTVREASVLNKEATFNVLEGSIMASNVIGSRVLTESGDEVGHVGDLELDLPSAGIAGYLLSPGMMDRLRGEDHGFPIGSVKSLGDALVMVENDVAVE